MIVQGDISARFARWGVALIWLLCAAMLIYAGRDAIVHLTFSDPDDALRTVEVRDWMAGQSWFDVSQHRSWPLLGAPMHWSRLVDIPIAALIVLAGLFVDAPMAERVALVAVPLLTLLCLFAIVYALTRRVSGRRDIGVVAAAMLALSLGVLVQFHPLRIDHHGWQITFGALGCLLLVNAQGGRPRYAVLAGIVVAASMTIAIEGLPLAIGIGAVLGLRYLRREAEGPALAAYLMALSAASALLMITTLGWPAAGVFWCDSLSPAYLVPMLAASLVLLAVRRLLPQDRMTMRLAGLALAGAAGAATFAGYSHQCLGGPFAALDPLVYSAWYINVAEGMPIWSQPLDQKILIPVQSILGLVGTLLAIRMDRADRREGWITLLCLQLLSFGVSIMVMRAMGLAHVLALPGSAWLFLTAFRAATGFRRSAARILLGVGCVVVTPIGAEAIASVLLLHAPANQKAETAEGLSDCLTYSGLRGIGALPPTVIFASLDIGSHLLAYTHHSVIATAHHRNRQGMKAVIAAFRTTPDRARPIIMATPAQYLAYCPTAEEVKHYAASDPHSLMAGLFKGRAPHWLEPVPMRKGETIRAYRILRDPQPATKRIATPFMQ